MVLSILREARFVDAREVACEYRRVLGDEGFEVSWCWCWAAASWVEVLGDDGVAEACVVLEFALHFSEGVVSGFFGRLRAFDDEFEALVQLIFDLFAVFKVFLWVFVEEI